MNTQIRTDLRKKAKDGIDRAGDTTVKMILAMLEVEEQEVESETTFEKEMQKRIDDYEQGAIVPVSLDEMEKRVRTNYHNPIQTGI
jgi:hypothetical protein